MTIPSKFLSAIWSKQPEGGYGFISTKNFDTGEWTDRSVTEVPEVLAPVGDHYFTPNRFSENRRLRKHALPGRWLYADLDEVDPRGLSIAPTLAWETSPGRFQSAWLLDRPVNPRRLEILNQKLTYFTGADRGGWSLTKVLRIPGSPSNKRREQGISWTVRLISTREGPGPLPTYTVQDMTALLADVDPQRGPEGGVPDLPDIDKLNAMSLWRRYRAALPARARQLFNATTVVRGDDRSARLWELEGLLLRAGLPAAHVLVLVRSTVWNKYAGQSRELRQLWSEINRQKQEEKASEQPPPPKKERKKINGHKMPELLTFRDFMTRPLPRPSWLVEGIWSETAHGVLAGEPKTLKSLFTLDLAVSIASGTPFLNSFAVPRTGPVILIQEENDPGDVHDRLLRISAARNLGPGVLPDATPGGTVIDFGQNLPIYLMNMEGFALTDEKWMKWLDERIARIKPALVVLDPLYLMTRGVDENSASEMIPILRNLLRLKQTHGTGVLIVHHYHKPQRESASKRSAHRISGTSAFHRWYASAVYAERVSPDGEAPVVIKLSSDHRSHGGNGAFRVTFDLGSPDDLVYGSHVEAWKNDEQMREEHLAQVKNQDLYTALMTVVPNGFFIQDWYAEFGYLDAKAMIADIEPLGFTVETRPYRDTGKQRRFAFIA